MEYLIKASVIAALTRQSLSQFPAALRFVLSLGEVIRWTFNRK